MTQIVPKSLWGVQNDQFYCPSVEDITADLTADLLSYVDPGLDLSPTSAEGQTVLIRARQYSLAWQSAKKIHDANDPDNAEGDLLDADCKLSGTARPGATSTTVVAQCVLTTGTTLPNGTAMANVTGKPDILLTPVADFVAPSDGTFDVTFECVDTGPIAIPPNSLQISAPISGWTSIVSADQGVTGHDVFDDVGLRKLRDQEIARTGTATVLALQADILAIGSDKIISCIVLENTGQTTDSNGLPPHTIAPIVYHSGLLVDAELAAVIWSGKSAGIDTFGDTPITFTDAFGTVHTVKYTPVVQVPIYLTYALVTTTGYDAAGAAAAIATAMTQITAPGSTVRALKAEAAALALAGVVDVSAFHLGLAPSPSGTANLAMDPLHLATFDPADITVT